MKTESDFRFFVFTVPLFYKSESKIALIATASFFIFRRWKCLAKNKKDTVESRFPAPKKYNKFPYFCTNSNNDGKTGRCL